MGVIRQYKVTRQVEWKRVVNTSLVLVAFLLAGISAVSLAMAVTSTIYSSLLSLVLLFALVAALPIIYRLVTKTFDPFETENIVIVFYSLYSLSIPLRILLSPEVTPEQLDLITKAFALCFVGLVFFLVGYHSRLGSLLARMIPCLPRQWDLKKVKQVARIYLLLGIALFFGLIAMVGITSYFQAGYAGRALLKQEHGPLELGLYVIQIALVLYIFRDFLIRRQPSFLIIALYASYILLILQLGIRRPLLGLLLASFAAWHYLVKRIPFTRVVAIAIIFGTMLLLFAFVRQPIASEGFIAGIEHLINNFSWTWFDISRTELGAPFRNLLDILTIVPNQTRYLYGLSYLQTIENLLPRFLYPERSLTLSQWYTEIFFSKEFVQVGGNMGFFIVSEAYINWDVIGVMIVMFSWGILLKALYVYMKRDRHNTSALFLYSISLAWIVFTIRIDFASAFKSFLITAFLPAMFAIILITTKFRVIRS